MVIQSEVESLNLLGLHDCALEEVQRTLETRVDSSILYEAVCTALSNKRYDLASEYADRLALIPDLEKKDRQIISLAYNHAGRHDEAYLMCRDAVFREGQSILGGNQCLGPERRVDHSDLKRIPDEFHSLLKAKKANAL